MVVDVDDGSGALPQSSSRASPSRRVRIVDPEESVVSAADDDPSRPTSAIVVESILMPPSSPVPGHGRSRANSTPTKRVRIVDELIPQPPDQPRAKSAAAPRRPERRASTGSLEDDSAIGRRPATADSALMNGLSLSPPRQRRPLVSAIPSESPDDVLRRLQESMKLEITAGDLNQQGMSPRRSPAVVPPFPVPSSPDFPQSGFLAELKVRRICGGISMLFIS